ASVPGIATSGWFEGSHAPAEWQALCHSGVGIWCFLKPRLASSRTHLDRCATGRLCGALRSYEFGERNLRQDTEPCPGEGAKKITTFHHSFSAFSARCSLARPPKSRLRRHPAPYTLECGPQDVTGSSPSSARP